ncbi:uncharacterized protein LOC128993950 [Macrosteles quadrilineatus]|uniref:uncharacterized protein LOC128993950 n=1 Tax=Macrosteles quadrilineatus TaxID=74068 RepID=UPI0023E0CE83|nr:uncharacterized protein LOC128993950 [Macrosteles quadrilineatus]
MRTRYLPMCLFINIILPKFCRSFVDVGTIFKFMEKNKIRTTPVPLDPKFFKSLEYLPKMVIIEPDGVLWPFEVETGVVKPFNITEYEASTELPKKNHRIWSEDLSIEHIELTDHNRKLLKMHNDATRAIVYLIKKRIKVAVAQTTKEIIIMRHLLHLFDIDHLFDFMELDMDSPVNHVKIIKEESGFDYQDLIYFGTNQTILNEIKEALNVTTIHVNSETGISFKHIYQAVYIYNIKDYMKVVRGKLTFLGKIVSDEEFEIKPLVQKMKSKRGTNSKQFRQFSPTLGSSFNVTKKITRNIDFTSHKVMKPPKKQSPKRMKNGRSRILTTKSQILFKSKTDQISKEIITRISGNEQKTVNSTHSNKEGGRPSRKSRKKCETPSMPKLEPLSKFLKNARTRRKNT